VTPLLTIVGAALGFAAGWMVHRTRRSVPEGSAVTAVPPPPQVASLADVLEDHPSGVVVCDTSGAVHFRNAAARSLRGTHVGVLIDEAVARHLAEARRGTSGDEVIELYGPPKTVVTVEARPLPLGGAVAFVQDISEQRRVEQVRTDFVANLSHELMTPIGALSVLAETLEEETDPATISRVVQRMMGESERASRTIDDLMELSRIELGGERNVEAVRVADVLRSALGRVTELAAQRDIHISYMGPSSGAQAADSIAVQGDRRQLVSAVGNLVENAVKYSEQGGLVQVWARRDGDWIELAVVDRGVGIPQRDLTRIFERFYRVDPARSRHTGGTGLGLSIVRHVATNHGGEVTVTSTEGEGSTFVLRLPARESIAGDMAIDDDMAIAADTGSDTDIGSDTDQRPTDHTATGLAPQIEGVA
jgi:two-component system sensor histidine kinase SenX3